MAQAIQATLISQSSSSSKSKKLAKAQVVVLVDGRSVTCHIQKGVDGRWTGRHPDKTVMAALDDAERVVSVAKKRLADAQKLLNLFEHAEGEEIVAPEDVEVALVEVGNARENLAQAKSELEPIKANAPRQPLFEF